MGSVTDIVGSKPVYIDLVCYQENINDWLEAHLLVDDATFMLEKIGPVSEMEKDAVSIWIDRWRNRADILDATLWIEFDVFDCIPNQETD